MWPFDKGKETPGTDDGNDWLVVGLGNPGRKYAGTRHNAGAMVLEALTRRTHGSFGTMTRSKKHKGLIAHGRLGDSRVILLFPQTFMNLSGESARVAADYFKIPTERVLVVFDDKDIPLGDLRLRAGGGAGGHNGVKSIIQHLGKQSFPRLRIGIGTEVSAKTQDAAGYVLGKPSKEEKSALAAAVDRAASAVEMVINEGLDTAMNRFN